MCRPASMIVTKSRVYWNPPEFGESHTSIRERYNLRDDLHGTQGVAIEIVPPNGDYSAPLDTWIFCVDQDIVPDWWNPKEAEIEGQTCYPDLKSLPEPVHGISIITPPSVTEQIVQQAADAGIQHVWMQPGAESLKAVELGESLGLNVIGDGSCILVVMGYREQ